MSSFDNIANLYDEIYYKPEVYEAEANWVIQTLERYQQTENRRLLDLACGTGTHLKFFLPKYEVHGLDLSGPMLDIARQKFPHLPFYQADMVDFQLPLEFGATLCLFGSIGFVRRREKMEQALCTFAHHLAPGGVLILVPWSTQEDFQPALVSDRVKNEAHKIVRMEKVARLEQNLVEISYHILVGDNRDQSIRYLTGKHPLIGLFSRSEYRAALQRAGLELVEFCQSKTIQMGMAYVCRKPA